MEPQGSLQHPQEPATCSYSEPEKSSPCPPSHFLKTHFNILFPSMSASQGGLHSSGFPTKILYAPLLSSIRATRPAHLILLDLITRIIFGELYRSLSSPLCSVQSSPIPCCVIFLRPKYPLHPILIHSQPTFLPECERLSFTHIQNNRQNSSSVYINLYIFG